MIEIVISVALYSSGIYIVIRTVLAIKELIEGYGGGT